MSFFRDRSLHVSLTLLPARQLSFTIAVWYCAVSNNLGILMRTYDLGAAQTVLGLSSPSNRGAIIPMDGLPPNGQPVDGDLGYNLQPVYGIAGDPSTLDKVWSSGSMWWYGQTDINTWRRMCAQQATVPGGSPTDSNIHVHTTGTSRTCFDTLSPSTCPMQPPSTDPRERAWCCAIWEF